MAEAVGQLAEDLIFHGRGYKRVGRLVASNAMTPEDPGLNPVFIILYR